MGPTLSMRGVDNASYYRLSPEDPRYYMDFTGCGNTLNMTHPRVLQLIMDSLRYWVTEMHVDGFRFDLASTLARELFEVDQLGAFFDIIHQDPVLSQVKLIAEPWDVGRGRLPGRQLPGPAGPSGTASTATASAASGRATAARPREFATRLAGSSDLYQESGRPPYASINFITCHDGFTLHDLVSYNDKHNEANGEDNRDGANDNNSWNCGAEGPTDDPDDQRAARAAEAQPDRHAVALAGRADDLRRRRAGPHAEGQQQRLLPGQRADLARLGARRRSSKEFLEFARKVARIWQEQPVFQRRQVLPGPGDPRLRHQGHLLVRARRRGDVGRGLERRLRQVPGRAAGRRPDRRRERARRADRRRHAAAAAQRPLRADPVPAAGDRSRSTTGSGCWTRPTLRRASADLQGGEAYQLQDRSLAVLRTRRPEETGQAISASQVETLLKARQRLPQPAGSESPAASASERS